MNELDTFDDMTPVEAAPVVSQEDIENDPSMDTFDNAVYTEKTDEVDKDSQVNTMDDKEDEEKPSKEDKKEEKPKDEKDDKKPETEEKVEGKEEEKSEVQGKAIKVKTADGKTVDVPEDGTVKVKVKGKSEFVSLQELRDNYSGQKAWTEEINTAKSKQQEAEEKLTAFQSEKQELATHLQKIAQMMDDEETNPLEAMNYLLDITGRDVNTYNKRIFDFMEKEVHAMSEMDDVERQNYWMKRELDSINNNQAAKAEQLKQQQAQEELLQRVNQLRESQGVSEDQFVEAHAELAKLGLDPDKKGAEFIIEYAAMKPYMDKAEAITMEYRDDLGDSDLDNLTTETAKVLKRRPDLSPEDALTISAKIIGLEVETVDDYVDQLNEKHIKETDSLKPSQKVAAKDDPNHFESFDDFDF